MDLLLQSQPQGSILGPLMLPIAIIILFWIIIILPQKREQKRKQQMLKSLKKGDKIVTIGGIHGEIESVKEFTIVLKVDKNTSIKVEKNAVAAVINEESKTKERGKKQ